MLDKVITNLNKIFGGAMRTDKLKKILIKSSKLV